MKKKINSNSFWNYFWIYVKSLFLSCLLILVISLFVLFFSMDESIAKILSFLSMLLGCAYAGYETSEFSEQSNKRNAFISSLLLALTFIVLSLIIKRSFGLTKYYWYLVIIGPILGLILASMSVNKKKTLIKKKRV